MPLPGHGPRSGQSARAEISPSYTGDPRHRSERPEEIRMPRPEMTIVQHPRPGQNYGPGKEPQAVRDAWDRHLQTQREAEQEPEAGAS